MAGMWMRKVLESDNGIPGKESAQSEKQNIPMTAEDYRLRAQSAREENKELQKSDNVTVSHFERALIGINDARIILNETIAETLDQQAKAREIAED